jgi:hypothetical protein
MTAKTGIVVLLCVFGLFGYGCYRKGSLDAASKAAADTRPNSKTIRTGTYPSSIQPHIRSDMPVDAEMVTQKPVKKTSPNVAKSLHNSQWKPETRKSRPNGW